jgi:putative protein-disulfide isomerase
MALFHGNPALSMDKTLHDVFDPLCGWCYGAGRTLAALTGTPGLELRLRPSGLFSGDGAHPIAA